MITRRAHPSMNAAIGASSRAVPALRLVGANPSPQFTASPQSTIGSAPLAAGLFGHCPGDNRIMLARVQELVCAYFSLPRIEMTSGRRGRDVARPRQISMYLCNRLTPLSKVDIGRRHGGRDHTTVIHACRQIEALRESDQAVERALRIIEQELSR